MSWATGAARYVKVRAHNFNVLSTGQGHSVVFLFGWTILIGIGQNWTLIRMPCSQDLHSIVFVACHTSCGHVMTSLIVSVILGKTRSIDMHFLSRSVLLLVNNTVCTWALRLSLSLSSYVFVSFCLLIHFFFMVKFVELAISNYPYCYSQVLQGKKPELCRLE